MASPIEGFASAGAAGFLRSCSSRAGERAACFPWLGSEAGACEGKLRGEAGIPVVRQQRAGCATCQRDAQLVAEELNISQYSLFLLDFS